MKLKLTKFIIIILCVIVVLGDILVIFNQPRFFDVLLNVSPLLAEKIYPDFLSSIDSIYFEKIDVNEDCIFLKAGTYDSGLIIKRVDFKVQGDLLKMYVYKGLVTEKDGVGLDVRYETDMTKINKVILVGTKEKTKEIWSR